MKTTTPLIGRKKEQETLLKVLNSNEAEMTLFNGSKSCHLTV